MMLDNRFQQYSLPQTSSTLRINVVIKGDQTKKVSIISRGSTKIQQLKRKIQREYEQLLNFKIIVALIQDRDGFTISNNSNIGDHVQNGSTIFIIPQEINLQNKMHLSNNLHDNFLSQRFLSNSFSDKMISNQQNDLEIKIPEGMNISDILPQVIYLGFWYNNKEVILNIARFFLILFEESNIHQYYSSDDNQKQKSLILNLLDFWLKEIDVLREKQFFLLVLQLVDKLSRSAKFALSCKNHPFIQSLLKLSKEQTIETIHQKQIIKIINVIVRGGGAGENIRRPLNSRGQKVQQGNQSYVPSFIDTGDYQTHDLTSTLQMIRSGSVEMRSLGLQIFQNNSKSFAAQLLSYADCLDKLRNIVCVNVSRASQKVIGQFIDQATKRIDRQKAVQLLHQSFLISMNRIFQQSSPYYHSKLNTFTQRIGQLAGYSGNVQHCLKLIHNPYKSLQQVSLKIIQNTSENNHKIFNQMIAKHMKQLIISSLQKDATIPAIVSILNIINNTLLEDQCRIQFLALKGIDVLAKLIKHPQVQIQRLAAKGLLNISLSSRQNKVKVLSSLSDYLQNMFKNRIDKVVEGYLQTMIKRK